MEIRLKDTLIKHDFHFNKKYGQNFISDTNLLDAIVEDAHITSDDVVVEVGAGAGTLTSSIAKKAKKVIAYEIDNNLKPVLEERLSGFSNIEVRFKDVMKEDKKAFDEIGPFKVVANLPYYITTPVIMFFLEECDLAQSITIMVQKEVADRLVAKAGTAEYGSITVAVDFYGEAKITRQVNRNMFYPVPNVDSTVLCITRRDKYSPKDKNTFLKTVKSAFLMRRKTLCNNLMQSFGLTREKALEAITSIGLDENIRGERLTAEEFVKLSNVLMDL